MNSRLLRVFVNVEGLQRRYVWAMNALPMVGMFGVMACVPVGLMFSLDIPWNAPIGTSPWGWWLAAMLLVGMLLGICAGWLLGTLLNIFVVAILHRWPLREGFQVFWLKLVPQRWYLPEWRGDASFGLREAQRKWDEQRAKGPVRGILRYAIPLALPAFAGSVIVPELMSPQPMTVQGLIYPALAWLTCGGLFGWVMWLMDSRPK
jgi:hypothetical protein